MSSLGKILLYVALVGALAAIVSAYFFIGKLNDTKTQLTQSQAMVETAKATAEKAKKEREAALKEKDDATKALDDSKKDLEDLNTKLEAAKKDQDKLQATIKDANDKAEKAADDLKKFQDVLGGMTADEAKAAIEKAKSEKVAAEAEQKILADQLQSKAKEVADLQDAINRTNEHGKMSPGISGRVTYVNRAWNFVVIDVGLANGVVPNGELIVYRGNSFLGKIKVTRVDPNDAVADILPTTKGDIQIGDYVLN